MALCSVQQVLDDVRALFSDTQVVGGEVFTNNYLLGVTGSGVSGNGSLFGEPYRAMFSRILGGSKKVQPTAYVILPANQTVLIPSTVGILDFSEPEMIEERPATAAIAIASTDTSTPINVTTSAPHGLSAIAEGTVSGVTTGATPPGQCTAPWGHWFATVTGPTTFSLNGSASDGIAGVGGSFIPDSSEPFTECFSSDFDSALDGQPQQVLGTYVWRTSRLQFRGSNSPIELRLTYYASGSAPVNPNYVIQVDDCRDFLAYATAANAATAKGWMNRYEYFRNKAYGDPSHPEEDSLIDLFFKRQVLAEQRGPSRRQMPFRDKRFKFGAYLLA